MSSLAHRHSAPATLDTRRIQGLAAIVAGPLFFAIVAVLTRVELDFMHRLGWRFTGDDDVPWPSGLALGGAGAVQGANFALAGILLALFTRGFRRELSASRSGRLAALLIAAIAGAFTLSAIPTDHATAVTGSPDTWHGYLHGIAFVVLMVASLAAPLATAVALRGNPRWRRFPALSLAVVVLELALSVGLGSLGDPVFAAWLAVVFGWFAALGAHLRRLQEADPLR